MAFISITKTRRPRQFNYTPIYYDARRERLEAVVSQAKQEHGEAHEASREVARERMRMAFGQARRTRRGGAAQPLRRALIFLALLAMILLVYVNL